MAKLKFEQPLLQSSLHHMMFQKSFYADFMLKKHFLLLSMLKSCAAYDFSIYFHNIFVINFLGFFDCSK